MAPRVTALVQERSGRVRVELDGAPWRTLPAVAVVRAQLLVGTELDRVRARELGRELRRAEALDVAARALRRRDRSTNALAGILAHRRIAAAERERVVAALVDAGALDDARFATARAEALAERGWGDAAIEHELEREGVDRELVAAAIARLPDERERAARIVARRGASPRTARRLAARGFSEDAIEAAVGALDEGA